MIVYGKQLFLHLLEKYPKKIEVVYLAKECDKKIFSKIAKLNVRIEKLDEKKAQALARGGNHQGFLAQIEPLRLVELSSLKNEEFLVVLSGVTDVGNIGAIIRSAYLFGASGIIVCGIRELKLESIIRTSSAAAFEVPICSVFNVLDVINELKVSKYKIYAADMNGVNIDGVEFDKKRVLLLGSEGFGLSKKVLEKSDEVVSIDIKKGFDSLNVSAAAAILCYRMKTL
ncbi:MAG: 23S rRNA (guanosine(2251)-2'-O)-methyltransferase RlmB [Campylobacteraceae bacterium]|jgi:23S rRNA (guanosine2251-2'-O)-methyltransferase|nr:23S rRNA (guanosine(2251)-2'-O)-methyltransferase RlmB [Campylobacteraceae bacterium]